MIVGDLSLSDVDAVYRRMGIKELLVYPHYQGLQLVGLITGSIEQFEGWDHSVGFLEHIIVLPDAPSRYRAMFELPKGCIRLLHQAGIQTAVLCIEDRDPRVVALEKWAHRVGFTKYADSDGRGWYSLSTERYSHG